MTKINDILSIKIKDDIKSVIDLNQQDEQDIVDELEGFILTESLAKHLGRSLIALHPLTNEIGIKQRCAHLDIDSFPHPLNPTVLAVPIISHQGIGFFTCECLDGH